MSPSHCLLCRKPLARRSTHCDRHHTGLACPPPRRGRPSRRPRLPNTTERTLRAAGIDWTCFYDVEHVRLRAHAHTDPAARRAGIDAALDVAHRLGATLYELRAVLDDLELRGEVERDAPADVVSRFPIDSGWPQTRTGR